LTSGVKLAIALHTSWGLDRSEYGRLCSQRCWDVIAQALTEVLRALKPTLAAFMVKCRAEVEIGFSIVDGKELRVDEGFMEFGEEEWACVIEEQFGPWDRHPDL
jgi:hypothetical protein